LATIKPLDEGAAVLAELARAIEHDLSTPDHAPAKERAYAHEWADFAAFRGRYRLAPLPAVLQTLALFLKALETQRIRSLAGLAAGTVGLSLPTLRRRIAAIASCYATAGLETRTEHSLVRRLLRRYSRARGTAVRNREPLLIEQLPAILAAMPGASREKFRDTDRKQDRPQSPRRYRRCAWQHGTKKRGTYARPLARGTPNIVARPNALKRRAIGRCCLASPLPSEVPGWLRSISWPAFRSNAA